MLVIVAALSIDTNWYNICKYPLTTKPNKCICVYICLYISSSTETEVILNNEYRLSAASSEKAFPPVNKIILLVENQI